MTEKLKHTAGPWSWRGERRKYESDDGVICTEDGETVCDFGGYDGRHNMIGMAPSETDLVLLLIAPTAPHHCSDPACPGDRNRRLLEAGEELAKSAGGLLDHLRVESGKYAIIRDDGEPMGFSDTLALGELMHDIDAALAEYRAAKEGA